MVDQPTADDHVEPRDVDHRAIPFGHVASGVDERRSRDVLGNGVRPRPNHAVAQDVVVRSVEELVEVRCRVSQVEGHFSARVRGHLIFFAAIAAIPSHDPRLRTLLSSLALARGRRRGVERGMHMFKRLASTSPQVHLLRMFEDGDYVFGHVYDLFRIADGKIVEHWDSIEAIPPRSEWKNENGKF
jgi:predicted SnoaL-like aldol condensation-catalyzing enzyme